MLRTIIYMKFGIISFIALIGAIFSSSLRLLMLGILVVSILVMMITYLTPEPPLWKL